MISYQALLRHTNIVFLFANGISYVNRTQDAWYRGIVQGLPLGEQAGEEQPVWWPAETLSPMGCVHRYQCHPRRDISFQRNAAAQLLLRFPLAGGDARYTLAPILALLERRRMKYTYLELVSNETLQLQRAAYQGIGTGRGEKLADLPLHYTRAGGGDDDA
ncbi:hypothetical protein L249_5701 [Ophiocordyceps polyrhachis-furcata BCC 54312]|uniref:Uncharacterized protein n=1 Tax=Ophiocordyceps polyrhachis-furcata BCC 54312 TaxID=1330021 RepID=A0A367L020_9HYPO|nr:hypothetical protein L249_5701 [Ophiocordyceps polyrhachis-furcata BCC 54312]